MKKRIFVEKIIFCPELKEVAAEWDALLEHSSRPTIYSCFDYVFTSCLHFKKDEEIYFLFFRDTLTHELMAIFPISVWDEKCLGINIKTLKHGITTENSDIDKPYPIIAKDYERICWERFRDYFRKESRRWDVIDYDELILDSYLNHGLKKLFPFPFYWTKAKPGPNSPIVRLDGSWNVFWNAHKNMRRKNRCMEKKIGGRFLYRVLSDPSDVERCLNEYIRIEKAGYKAGEGVSMPGNIPFYQDLLSRLAKKGQLFFGIMYDGETVISAEISYTYLDRVYFALGTYHPEYASFSPGTVSTSRFIQYFYNKEYVDGDFLAGFAHYVNSWAYRIEKTNNVTIRRMGWKNWYLAGLHLKRKMKTKLKHLLNGIPIHKSISGMLDRSVEFPVAKESNGQRPTARPQSIYPPVFPP